MSRFIKRYLFCYLLWLRFLGFRFGVVDGSIGWTGITYLELFRMMLLKRVVLLQMQDVIHWFPFDGVVDLPDGFLSYDSVLYGVCDELQMQPWEIDEKDPEHRSIALKYYHDFVMYQYGLNQLNERVRPSFFVYCQGYMTGAYACRRFAIESDVPFLALENTSDETRLLWDNVSGVSVNRTLARNYFWRMQDICSEEQVMGYCRDKIRNIRSNKLEEHVSGEALLGARNRPFLLYLGQVYTDTSLLFSSLRELTPEVVVQTLSKQADELGMDLVVKLHPKEDGSNSSMAKVPYDRLSYRKLLSVLSNEELVRVIIDYDNRFDTYQLIQDASLVVTINSQAGLEGALFGKPVVTCGYGNYTDFGFTYECTNPEELRESVNAGLCRSSAKAQEDYRLACFYDYIYFQHYCVKKTANELLRLICTKCL